MTLWCTEDVYELKRNQQISKTFLPFKSKFLNISNKCFLSSLPPCRSSRAFSIGKKDTFGGALILWNSLIMVFVGFSGQFLDSFFDDFLYDFFEI